MPSHSLLLDIGEIELAMGSVVTDSPRSESDELLFFSPIVTNT